MDDAPDVPEGETIGERLRTADDDGAQLKKLFDESVAAAGPRL